MENNDIFGGKSIPKTYIKFALPVVFTMVIALVYNLADTFFIAQTGDINLVAGVSICVPIITLLMAFGNIYGQGGSSIIARLLGAGKNEDAKRVSSFCWYIAILTGVVIGALLVIFQNPVLKLLGASDATINYARDYYLILAISAPLNILTFIHSNLLRSEGMAFQAMIGSVSGSILNIILDPIFISVFGWGAKGAAFATALGYLCSDIIFAYVVLRKSRVLSISPKLIKITKEYCGQIFGIGIPAAITNLMSSIAQILVNQFLLPYGDDRIGAMGIAMKVSMIVMLIVVGFSFGGAPLYGFLYGSGDKAKLNKLIRFAVTLLCSVALVLSALIIIFAKPIMSIFMDNANMIAIGVPMIRLQVVCMVFMAIVQVIQVIFQSTGKILGSFVLSISRQGFVFFIAIAVMSFMFKYNGVIAAQAASDVLSAVLAVWLFFMYFVKKKHEK
ncbi:MAG: MATE family efflux transporter [Clostridia bacterium]|nr:MATE family efflux transporter [Clostridia bacterium]